MAKIIDEYEIEAENVIVNVEIIEYGNKPVKYRLILQEIGIGTEALLDQIRQELVLDVDITTAEILDPKVIDYIKSKFKSKAQSILERKIPTLNEDTKSFLVSTLLNDIIGLGNIEYLMHDENLEEVIINSSSEPVRVFHKKFGWLITNVIIPTEDQIQNYSNIIARRVGKQITTLTPLLDAHLITGDRANAVLYPISNKGNTITIRKFARDPWTMVDIMRVGTVNSDVYALIWIAMEYEMNILISGGTGSGKTSLLGTILPFIPPNQRILTIEDTRELQLPETLYWCPLTTRPPNTEGKGEVSMLDLLVNALRMRPDRIILGEMRKKQEAEVMFEAMHTGHSVYATVHADTVSETITRMTNPPISTPANLLSAVNLNVVQFRDRRRGIRRTYQLGEFIASETDKGVDVKANIMYRWKPSIDKIVPHSESIRFFEELSRHTGFNMDEINENIALRKRILEWMVRHNVKGVDSVGSIMNQYYLNKEDLIKMVENDQSPQRIFNLPNPFKVAKNE
ncbi:Flp pilus assembly complex ATPase component TadA [Candidatus Woesearchaeota archaeon]|nr:Flp pilus assembly complex ATPase component TadA [Candidatus Woesearchaeota archaeon]